MQNQIKNFAREEKGVAALEFAIIAPIVLICAFGSLCLGMYFGAVHAVQQLAAEAARASIPGLNNNDRVTLATTKVMNDVGSYPFLTPSRMKVASVDTDPATESFTVTLRYDASAMPLFDLPYVPLPPQVITRSASVQRGGF